jgi:hypothetical protein
MSTVAVSAFGSEMTLCTCGPRHGRRIDVPTDIDGVPGVCLHVYAKGLSKLGSLRPGRRRDNLRHACSDITADAADGTTVRSEDPP